MSEQRKIKVLCVDDSLVFGSFLSEQLPKLNPRIQVVGHAIDAFDAMEKIPALKPDVITLDVEMPRMSGLEFLKTLLPRHKLPVILVSALNIRVFEALSAGAVDFVKKPDMSRDYTAQVFAQNLVSKIVIASMATIHVPASTVTPAAPAVRRPSQPAVSGLTPALSSRALSSLIAIGASTGGTEATLQILKDLPGEIPPIIITQHMPEGFTNMYAERLNRLCKMEVREAKNGDQLKPGLALIAPGGTLQTTVVRIGSRYTVKCQPGDKVNGHCPSVDVLFRSVARTAGANAVGVILTGMGQDGASGLLQMRNAGAYTIGQDKASCVVYGMPMVAHQLGAVSVQAPCENIARSLMNHLRKI